MAFIYALIAALTALALGAALLFLGDFIDILFDSGTKERLQKKWASEEEQILDGTSLNKDMKTALEPVLLSWENADTTYLTGRMDKTFRAMQENSIHILAHHGLRRKVRFGALHKENAGKPGNFLSWNDGGRQWREGAATGLAIEQYIDVNGNITHSEYFRSARIAVRQSRNVKCSDLSKEKERKKQGGKKGNKEFYEEERAQKCYSCGADIEINGAETVCPYCGRPVFSNFYDWQTQDVQFERVHAWKSIIDAIPLFPITFLATLALLLPFGDSIDGDVAFGLIMAGIGTVVGIVLTLALIILYEKFFGEKKKLQSVTRFYENLFRSSILSELWKSADQNSTLDLWLGKIKYHKVINTEEESTIIASVPVSTRLIDSQGRISVVTKKMRLSMVRVRYPQKIKSKGEMFQNKSCPSCGVPFLPDDKGCCSYCGYGLSVDNSRWKIKEILN